MGIFDFLKPFISVKEFENTSKNQKYSAIKYLNLLRRYDKKKEESKCMEFFFYSKTLVNATDLKRDLENMGYEIYGIDKSLRNQYSITGVTPPINLEEENFNKWIEKMNEIGFINDCIFDGWGTISFLD